MVSTVLDQARLGPGSWPFGLAMRMGSKWQVEDWMEAYYFFLLSGRKNRDGESCKTKVSGFAGWVREPCQARKDFADSMQAEFGRARCPGNSGIYTLS